VSIKTAGVENAQLVNKDIGFTGNTGGTFTVDLGSSFNIVGNTLQGVSTVSDAAGVVVTVADATNSTKGVASFVAADFSVVDGEVGLIAKDLDSLTDVVIDGPTLGDALIYDGSDFVNTGIYYLYESSTPTTTHTITHGIGQKFCNVTVADDTDDVIIPQSITFYDANSLIVTFTSSINCKVIVMGVPMAPPPPPQA
jgi:hypothetical protein